MKPHPFESALGRIAVVGSDFGADCAYRAILDLLGRHQMTEAYELVETYGRESIDIALRAEAWRADQEPSVSEQQPEAIAEKARRPGGQHGMG